MAVGTKKRKRGRGRPRVNAPGSSPLFTQLNPQSRARLEKLAAAERRSLSLMAATLIEEALKARGVGS